MTTHESPPPPWTPPRPLPGPIETDRLTLRWLEESDAGALHAAVDASRAELWPWLPWSTDAHLTPAASLEDIRRFATRRVPEGGEPPDYTMGIFERGTGSLVGGTGLHRLLPGLHTAEIGYWVRTSRQREGLCTEAVRALISRAFEPQSEGGWGLRRLHIFCAAANTASRGVPHRLGLGPGFKLRQERWVAGIGWCDSLGWDVLAAEWDTQRHTIRG